MKDKIILGHLKGIVKILKKGKLPGAYKVNDWEIYSLMLQSRINEAMYEAKNAIRLMEKDLERKDVDKTNKKQ